MDISCEEEAMCCRYYTLLFDENQQKSPLDDGQNVSRLQYSDHRLRWLIHRAFPGRSSLKNIATTPTFAVLQPSFDMPPCWGIQSHSNCTSLHLPNVSYS